MTPTPRWHTTSARTRTLAALAVGAVVGTAAVFVAAWQNAALLFWHGVAVTMLGGFWPSARKMDAATTRRLATQEDDSRASAHSLVIGASLASLASVGFAIVKAAQGEGVAKAVTTVLAVTSIVLAWAVVHTVFVLRYAHEYYRPETGTGVDFNDDEAPDYRDFAYLAFTIGMTYQVSDTNITTKSMRRIALRHALLSFVFGTAIIAMTINVVAQIVGSG